MHPITQNYPIYKTLALEIFVDCDPKEVLSLRSSLYGLLKGLETTNEVNTGVGREFSKYLMVAHLLNLKNIYKEKGLQ
jgi:intraflagellar transport protein 172